MIKAIIFDIGNVLVDFNWKAYLDSFPYSLETKEALSNAMFLSPAWNECDRGELSYEELIDLFEENAPGYYQEIETVFRTAGKSVHQFEYAIPWIKSLKSAGMDIYILSNYGEHMYRQTQEALSFLNYVDGGIFSYEVKMIKPAPIIYKTLLERYNLNPEEAVFIDDNMANIEVARALGIYGIHFTSKDEATKELEALGIYEH